MKSFVFKKGLEEIPTNSIVLKISYAFSEDRYILQPKIHFPEFSFMRHLLLKGQFTKLDCHLTVVIFNPEEESHKRRKHTIHRSMFAKQKKLKLAFIAEMSFQLNFGSVFGLNVLILLFIPCREMKRL